MKKEQVREIGLTKRKNIVNKEIKSEIIVHKIKALKRYQESRVVALYKNLPDEVCLDALLNLEEKIFLLPRVAKNDIVFIRIDNNTKFERSAFKVLEPVMYEKNIWHDNIDLILVPGVAFDRAKNRIGYGKGYYDRFLKMSSAFKVGICFSEQVVDKISIDCHDIPVDLIINEKESF